jgi:hypothetical protein
MAAKGHERSSPLAKPTARFRARDHFDVPLIACTPAPVARKTQSAGTRRRCRIRILASLAIRRAVALPRGGGDAQRTVRGHRAHAGATIRCLAAGRRCVLTCLSRGTGVQVGATFDVVTPPLAAERMVRLSTQEWVFVQKCLPERKCSYLTEIRAIFAQSPCGW